MTEQNDEHFEVISENKAKEFEKKQTYKPLPDSLFIEESLINGQGLFASIDITANTDLGISHIEVEKNKMAEMEMIRTPLGGFINHETLLLLIRALNSIKNWHFVVSVYGFYRHQRPLFAQALNQFPHF